MNESITSREAARAWQAHHEPGAPKSGDRAPDFELRDPTGTEAVRLSDFSGERPVALVFGSFT